MSGADPDIAFRAELVRLIPHLRAFARSLCGDATAADDLAQDAMLKAWDARASFQSGTNMKAWAFMILRNQFYSLRRRSWRQIQLDQEAAERTLVAVDDPAAPVAQPFRTPVHCAEMSNDGFVYVCDRPNDRIQIFTREGKFVREVFVARETRADGSVWDIAFSKDADQQFLYVADGVNEHVRVFDRKSMEELYNFGYGGRQPGMFLGVHSIATDSKGNIYTTETYTGKRLQRFVNKGLGSIPKSGQVPWPGM